VYARVGVGLGILAVLVVRLGADPFVDALRMTNVPALVAAVAITALTTACCAWRWSLIAGSLGVDLPARTAFTSYYRSQLLNATLPGGVLGDVHRAVRHGRDVGDVGGGLRSVAWERSLGQVVQMTLTLVILLALPSPVRSWALVLAVGVVVAAVLVVLVRRVSTRSSRPRTRAVRAVADDLRRIMRTPRARMGIGLASGGAVLGHAAIFLIAVRIAGATASTARLLPLVVLVLLASAVPMNVAGWGPREGVAAWAFSSAGLSAAQGVTSGVVFGVMALVATLPGVLVLIADRRVHRPESRTLPALEDAAHG